MMQQTDVAVIGAGPAGIAAALAAAGSGASVVLIDENVAIGGHLRWTIGRPADLEAPFDGLRGVEIADRAARELEVAGVRVLTKTIAWGLFEGNVIGIVSNEDASRIQATSIIVATGSTDIIFPFPGWELPGVLAATAALRMLHLDRVLPGRRVVVVGDGGLADTVAADIEVFGANVVGRVVDVAGLSASGAGGVEWVEQAGVRTDCDAIVLALGRQPDAQLALQAQAHLTYSTTDEMFAPTRSKSLETSIAGLYVVGDAAGVGTVAHAFAEGRVAGLAASGSAGAADVIERWRSLPASADALPQMHEVDDATMVCRCEEVAAGAIRAAIDEGSLSLNDIKRKTRAGMGICQGIYCHRTVARMLAKQTGVGLETIIPMTARPPARLVPMAALADSHE